MTYQVYLLGPAHYCLPNDTGKDTIYQDLGQADSTSALMIAVEISLA